MQKSESNQKTWHLGQNEKEIKIIDFEFLFWRIYYSWIRWQEDCQAAFLKDGLTAQEIALLHIIRMKDRPKTIYEIGRLLNRDDLPNMQYGVKKLIQLGYVTKTNSKLSAKKEVVYQATKKGIDNTEKYLTGRKNILLKLIQEYGIEDKEFIEATKFLNTMKSIFEEASRISYTYHQDNIT